MSDTKSKMTARRPEKFAVEERLVSGERVLESAIIHNGIYWKSVAVFLISIIFALFVAFELGVLLAVVSIIMVFHAIVRKQILLLIVTNKRIFFRYGILQVDVVDIHLDKVESVELERMWTGYMFGYSNVVVMGTGNRYVMIPYIANGIAIRKAFNETTLGAEEKAKDKE